MSLIFRACSRKMSFRSPPEVVLRRAISKNGSPQKTNFSTAQPSKYKAAMCTALNEPLQIQELTRSSQLAKNQVRIRIRSASINFADILMAKGAYQEKPPMPFTGGSELAGEVVQADENVKNVKVGDRVIGMAMKGGAFAEEIILPSQGLIPIPPQIDYPEAAAILCAYATAYMTLQRTCAIKEGETVLVTAAAGGVGLAAVDLATHVFNAKVIGACGSDEKCEIVKSKGAVEAINYNKESIIDATKRITNGKGVNVIIDAVGGDLFSDLLKVIAFEGRIAVVGFAGGVIPKIPANKLLLKSCSVVGIYWGSYQQKNPQAFQESIQGVLKAATEKKISPHISQIFPLDQINEAFKFITDRKSTGKVVLQI